MFGAVVESCGPTLWAMASPNDQMMWMVSSATMGMNSTPVDRHPVRCDVSLRWTPICMDQFSKESVPLNHSARTAL